jgi:hypothetical protein
MPPDASGALFARDAADPSATQIGSSAAAWAVAMADVALELHGSFPDLDATIAAIAASAVKILPNVTAAGVARISKDGVLTCVTASNPQVLQMTQAEYRAGRGPLLQVLDQAQPAKVLVDVADGDARWRQYAEEALAIGVAAVMAVRLDDGAGAADQALLLVTDSGFDTSVVDVIDVFAAHAAVAASQARVHAELAGALQTRDVIGQAKGILMHRHQMTSAQAFRLLVKTSQNTNIALRQVAEQVATTGEER